MKINDSLLDFKEFTKIYRLDDDYEFDFDHDDDHDDDHNHKYKKKKFFN